MFITSVCAPALIYIGFSLIQIFIDIYNNSINSAFLKFIFMLVFTLIINILCDLGFVVIAWIIVFIPIIMMTLVSTLLLQVFGLDSKNPELTSQINMKDICANDIELSGSDLLNQQKYAYQYDAYKIDTRIDRDAIRSKFYDNIDETYGLPYNYDSIYDLSNNPRKYFITDRILNYFSEFSFAKHIQNSELYNSIFSNTLANDKVLYNDYISARYEIDPVDLLRPSHMSYTRDEYDLLTPSQISSRKVGYDMYKLKKNGSYNYKYDNIYKVDGYDLFKRNKYESVKRDLQSNDPGITSTKIDERIEDMWNDLSEAERKAWNKSNDAKRTSEYELDYNHLDLRSYGTNRTNHIVSSLDKYVNNRTCPSNETPATYKSKTGLDCYEICPPGKVRNADGDCRS